MLNSVTLPEWKCHKIVRAAKIVSPPNSVRIDPEHGSVYDFLVDVGDGVPVRYTVKAEVTRRYFPVVGDYLIVYRDGYVSVSPRSEFENGYARA